MGSVKTRVEIHSQVQDVFRQVFEDPDLVVSGETMAADIPAWNSLTHISLILALEEDFGIQFLSEEVMSMTCVEDLLTILANKEVRDG